jgi:superfamily II DNA helicase RecQ
MNDNDAEGFYASKGIIWSDPGNQSVLLERLTTSVFVPRPWQIEATARLLDGQDLLLIAATGQGKSSIIYLPIQARPDKLALVVTPTILLEHDHVRAMAIQLISAHFVH